MTKPCKECKKEMEQVEETADFHTTGITYWCENCGTLLEVVVKHDYDEPNVYENWRVPMLQR